MMPAFTAAGNTAESVSASSGNRSTNSAASRRSGSSRRGPASQDWRCRRQCERRAWAAGRRGRPSDVPWQRPLIELSRWVGSAAGSRGRRWVARWRGTRQNRRVGVRRGVDDGGDWGDRR
jgi:hypothetical protein